MSNEMSDETICQKWKNKICQKLQDIENTNGLEEHLSECTNNMDCRVKPNSTRKAKKYNLSGLSDDETYTADMCEYNHGTYGLAIY
jgi:hypothetical protein